ncbi:Transcriptional adapter 1 [Bagarius yarrelli]|uniref:Transcriptional adapter 1 n=1 Tax=Bagarius yarrelli TaxID=175774 RepID=A0A556V0Y4_BAGYA|nr:Transcriptional adapter 1 [Bagarius yarrelli]
MVGADAAEGPGGSTSKPAKPKGKKKFSSVRQKFDHRFQPHNPLSGAQTFSPRDTAAAEEEEMKLSAHTLLLPTRGQLEARMMYAFGSDITPQPYLKNSLAAYHTVTDYASLPAVPPPQVSPDDAEQQAAFLLACSGSSAPAPLPPISMYDLLEALQVNRSVMPSHTVYALNVERIIARLWHPSHEELEQDHIHRQRLAAKEGLLLC